MVVDCEMKLIAGASGSVPVFTDHLSTPQFGVGFGEGVGLGDGDAPQLIAGDELLRGLGAPVAKSLLLLSVSVQPLLIRRTAFVLLGAFVALAPSKQFALPYPTKSTTGPPSGHEPESVVVLFTSAIFPAVALTAIAPVASGAGRSAVPAEPWAS